MASTDYDAPRSPAAEKDSLEELQARRKDGSSGVIDLDDADLADTFALPGDQLDEELSVTVVPMQTDEFRCGRCFLVRHRTQRADGGEVCVDCS